jgi:hypothetical protein
MPRAGGFIDRTRQKSLFFHTSARASAAHQPNLLASRRCGMNKIYEAPGFDFVKNWSINTRKPYFLLTIIRTRHPNCFFSIIFWQFGFVTTRTSCSHIGLVREWLACRYSSRE